MIMTNSGDKVFYLSFLKMIFHARMQSIISKPGFRRFESRWYGMAAIKMNAFSLVMQLCVASRIPHYTGVNRSSQALWRHANNATKKMIDLYYKSSRWQFIILSKQSQPGVVPPRTCNLQIFIRFTFEWIERLWTTDFPLTPPPK